MLGGYALCNFLWNTAVCVSPFCFCEVSVFSLQVGFAFVVRCSVSVTACPLACPIYKQCDGQHMLTPELVVYRNST